MTELIAPIKIIDAHTLSSKYQLHPIKEQNANIKELFSTYEISVQFGRKQPAEHIEVFYIKTDVNPKGDKMALGYELFAEIVNIFDVTDVKNQYSGSEYEKYILFSALGISINNLRTILRDLTISAPYGPYILPSLNIGALVQSSYTQNNPSSDTSQVHKGSIEKKSVPPGKMVV
jgi:hypothetical protein